MGSAARLVAFAVSAAACSVWTLVAGKDVNWDLLNYHYYLPFELLAGRLEQDFFAASAQSYLNPVGYVPFYLMVSSGWHSVFASVALAVAHSSSLALLYFLAWRVFAHLPPRERIGFSCLAAATGGATAVFWATVGASFLDPLLAPLLLGGLLLLLDAGRSAALRALAAGALFGAAAALKYSNAIFAIAALPLVFAMPGATRGLRLRAFLAYAAGGALAVGVLAGPWLAMLYREFGNPVFPLMNAWFRSPDAPPFNPGSERFAPQGWLAVLLFPFRMVFLDRALYSEMFAPDIRFAALTFAALALPVARAMQRGRAEGVLRATDWRVLAFFGASAALWLATSANARYGMVVLLLTGVCLARLVERLLPCGAARVALMVVLAVQLGTSMLASPSRWFLAEPWSSRWLPYAAPERALREPALYLTLEVLSMSVIAPFVHPGSSFVNFRGQTSLSPDSPRLAALLARHRGQVRVLGRALDLVGGKPNDGDVKAFDDTLIRIGYRVDTGDCFTIAWRPQSDDPVSRGANWLALAPTAPEPLSAVSCALRPAARDAARSEAERRVSALFDRMERACPEVFHGHTAVTEPLRSGWSRYYVDLDARLETVGDRVVLNRYRAGSSVELGRLSDWEARAGLPAACGGGSAEGRGS